MDNFLPKYPNIVPLLEPVLNLYGEGFYEAIYRKNEFYQERLSREESFPESIGTLMKHQKLIARFLASQTLYDQILMVHSMGTGKTCSAIGAIEQIKRQKASGFVGALILARGEGLLNNFVNELMFKCTTGAYIPEDYENLTELEKVRRRKKLIREFYQLETFETFAKEIRRYSDTRLREKYSNRIIVIDEVHNLRIQDKAAGLDVYGQFHRLLHAVENCKIILMSGTPMKDDPEELASVMNLILPLDQQLPTKEAFQTEFLDVDDRGVYTLRPSKVPDLKRALKGRVSYLSAMRSSVEQVFIGSDGLGSLSHFTVTEDYMSDFQTTHYDKAYEKDRGDRGVYSNARQAILFVFPDGSYGPEGFARYITQRERRRPAVGNDGKQRKMYDYGLSPELHKELWAETNEGRLAKLERFSSKYAATVRNILEARDEGRSVFVYCEFVQGSGAILFGAILSLFGFTKATGKEAPGSERPRYALITNKTSTQKEIKDLVARFNKPDNMHGKIINVVIGSRVIGEGFSLFNVQDENILTPHWNYSETAQAIARGYRLGSHNGLLSIGETPVLRVYQRVSIPASDKEPSIDMQMYQLSELKDINIRHIERVLKEVAFDCALTYERNFVPGKDGSRDCDYLECDYKCDGIPPELIGADLDDDQLDYSTYQLYYAGDTIRRLKREIASLFREHFRFDLETMKQLFPDATEFELLTALRSLVDESVPVTNKYGLPSYLKEEGNVFFLIDSLSVTGGLLSEYYTRRPNIQASRSFADIVGSMYWESLPNVVQNLCNASSADQVRAAISKLPPEVKEMILESSLLAERKGIEKGATVRKLILDHFSGVFGNFSGVTVSWFRYDDTGVLRCLGDDDKWVDCPARYEEILEEHREKAKENLEKNPYGYYGTYNRELNEFCIRDVTSQVETKDKRKIRTGKRCQNWGRTRLAEMITKLFKIQPPVDFQPNQTKAELIKALKESKYAKDLYTESDSKEDLRRALYWSKMTVSKLCTALKEWFVVNDLMIDDPGCGQRLAKK